MWGMGCIVEQQGGDEDAMGMGWKWNETGLAGCGGDGMISIPVQVSDFFARFY